MIKNFFRCVLPFFVGFVAGCSQNSDLSSIHPPNDQTPRQPDAVSLLGNPLYLPAPNEKILAKQSARKRDFEAAPGILTI